MKFSQIAKFLKSLEETPSRNQMISVLAEMFETASPHEAQELAYLSQGRIAPFFVPLEFGMADKMVIKAISHAFGKSEAEVTILFKSKGDLGVVAESLAQLAQGKEKGRTVHEVFEYLEKITRSSGTGSVEQKTNLLAEILKDLDPLSARYLVRIPLGRLRLGFSDMTVLDSLSWLLTGSKAARGEIEKAYNVRPDLGFIAKTIKEKDVKGLSGVEPAVGVPILMARAERLSSAEEIIKKIGRCAVEPKIDGFRLAVHKNGREVQIFTRNMENVTFMYPDLVKGVLKQVSGTKVILEGEAVAYNPQTGEYLPFQETVQRKRKYEIEKKAIEIPLRLFCFDILYLNGKNFIPQTYAKRRQELAKAVKEGNTLSLTDEKVVEKPEELEAIFQDSISRGLEGVMAKRLDGVYQAGARGWNWIKYKRSYQGKLEDMVDAVVMGYDYGQGKRTGFGIGAFLIGVYDAKTDTFKTIAKIGTGLTDEEWRTLKKRSEERKVEQKPARYEVDKLAFCDVWVRPEMVVVVRADEISRSPVHTAGRTATEPGFALRFPRLVDWRDDKSPEDATTVKEMEEMYQLQFRKKK